MVQNVDGIPCHIASCIAGETNSHFMSGAVQAALQGCKPHVSLITADESAGVATCRRWCCC